MIYILWFRKKPKTTKSTKVVPITAKPIVTNDPGTTAANGETEKKVMIFFSI